jgi:hypothetical protein
MTAQPALAQSRSPAPGATAPAAAQPAIPIPDQLSVSKLVWSTMAAVDHANKTGNYSVLHALGSANFQSTNTVTTLAAIFASIRQQRIDLSDTLLFEPAFEFPPRAERGLLRVRGAFRMRPRAVQFDLLYEWNNGWKLFGIALAPANMPS